MTYKILQLTSFWRLWPSPMSTWPNFFKIKTDSGKILALFPPLLVQVSLWCLSSFDLYLHLLGMQDKHDIVLAAISSSRSDWVTKFVRSSSFFDSQVFLQFEAYYVKELPTIVLGVVIFCIWWTLLKLWSWSLKLKIDADFEVAVWRGRLM